MSGSAPAQVRLNELVAATNNRLLLEDERGRPRPGTGPFWADPGFSGPGWLTGTAPLGFGGAAGLGTNVAGLMQNRTPNLYLRRTFTLTQGALDAGGQLQLRVRFDDAFIAWINGHEVARANAGPAGHFIYADQKAYNFASSTNNAAYTPNNQTGTAPAAPGTGMLYTLANQNNFLQAGENVLAIQLINREPNVSARIDTQLQLIQTDTTVSAVDFGAPGWSYFPGLAEPSGGVVEPADYALPGSTAGYNDWIELLNTGAASVDLSNWSLTDQRSDLRKFVFPAGTTLAAGAALIVVADDRTAPAGAAWLHAPFSLSAGGEYVALADAAGAVVDALDPGYPPQNSFHSWGRDPVTGAWGFLRQASPGLPNTGTALPARTAPPDFSLTGGFYAAPVEVTLTTATPGATIRYTLDGTEPSADSGTLYAGPLTLTKVNERIGRVVTARAFSPGLLPSPPVTHTYLLDQNANLRKAPAMVLSGDPGTVFYKPLGVMAIQGGTYPSSQWAPNSPTAYNIPVGDGRYLDPDSSSRPYERPAFVEYFYPDNRPGFREAAGLRISSSPYSRPRLVLSGSPNQTLWSADSTQKPSFNIFFRSAYGNKSISHPLIPETPVRRFEEIRLRAGKNDISNPFIRDEYIRRLWTDMGQTGTTGSFVTLYLNGVFKGYYNLVERIREPFMQAHHNSSAKWDVNYIGTFENGDNVHWNSVLQPRLNANLQQKSNWDALREVLDVENVADYFLLNVFTAMWDWPHNNWAMARERSATGRWRCYVWDAEGGYGLYGNKGPSWQTLRDDLLNPSGTNNNTPVPVMFRRLMTSPEFRLLFADRVQKHLFNGGALTDPRTSARRASTQAEVAPLMAVAGISPETSWYNNWHSASAGRRVYLFPRGTAKGQLRDPNQDGNLADTLWPLTLPPELSQHGGTLTPGFTLAITHGAAAGSPVYFTTDGSDPRGWGDAVAPAARIFSAPIPLTGSSVTVKTRVRDSGTNEWSPLTEALFTAPSVPATAANIVITEIMYNPPPLTAAEITAGFTDKEDFEYLVLENIGPAPVDITTLRFQLGITATLTSSPRPVIDPGQRFLLARKPDALRTRYGSGIDTVLGGEFFGNLSNSGEQLRLEVSADASPIKDFIYGDDAPWPNAADGNGSSLLLVNPSANPDPALPASWTASAAPGGTPAGVPAALDYAAWSSWIFSPSQLATPGRTGPADDFDGDGQVNLIEFLTGSDPANPAASPFLTWEIQPGDAGARTVRLTFPRLPGTINHTLEAQSSDDLVTWRSDLTLSSSEAQADGAVREQWTKSVAPPLTRQYLRLRAVPAL